MGPGRKWNSLSVGDTSLTGEASRARESWKSHPLRSMGAVVRSWSEGSEQTAWRRWRLSSHLEGEQEFHGQKTGPGEHVVPTHSPVGETEAQTGFHTLSFSTGGVLRVDGVEMSWVPWGGCPLRRTGPSPGLCGHIDLGSYPSAALLCWVTLGTSLHNCPVLLFLHSAPDKWPPLASQHTVAIPTSAPLVLLFPRLNYFPVWFLFILLVSAPTGPHWMIFLEEPPLLSLLIPCLCCIVFGVRFAHHLASFYLLRVLCLTVPLEGRTGLFSS